MREHGWWLLGWTTGPGPDRAAEARLTGADRCARSGGGGKVLDARAQPSEPGAGGRARPTRSEDLTDRGEKKTKKQTKARRLPHVSLQRNRGWSSEPDEVVEFRKAASAHPAPPDRGASPRPASPRFGPGEGVEAKRATRPSGTSRLRSSVVNKVWPPPPRWFAS